MRFTVLMLVGLLALGISPGERVVATGAAADTSCAVTSVHYSPYRGVGKAGTPRLPWIAATPRSSHIIGFLFYNLTGVRDTAGFPHINGNGPVEGSSAKILWYVASGVGKPTLKISGENLSTPDTMRSVLPEALSPANNYPSILDVASAGCWRLTIRNGKVKGHVTLDVLP
ncbi:MAG TPA: hypothetical protein VF221_11895 [Chloroflexota bacterium]